MRTHKLMGLLPLFLLSFLALVSCSVSQPSSAAGTAAEHDHKAEEHEHDDGNHEHEANTHHEEMGQEHMHAEIPAAYQGLQNPFAHDEEAIAAGKLIFEANCAPCHGLSGRGDGPAAADLDPKPANLADSNMIGMHGDDYLFWRVNEGGAQAPFNSAMPAWKSTLSEEEIWQVISYVHTLASP